MGIIKKMTVFGGQLYGIPKKGIVANGKGYSDGNQYKDKKGFVEIS